MKKVGNVVESTSGMKVRGFKSCIKWADGSKSHYKNKKEALSELRSEVGKR